VKLVPCCKPAGELTKIDALTTSRICIWQGYYSDDNAEYDNDVYYEHNETRNQWYRLEDE